MLGKIRDSLEKTLFDFCKESGFLRPTPFQKTVIPHILQGRDLSADITRAFGKTASVLLALAIMYKENGDNKRALILTDSDENLKKLSYEMRRIFQNNKLGLTWSVAGLENNIKKELRQLSKPVDILAGTGVRIIDHIRRENLQIGDTDVLVIIKDSDDGNEAIPDEGFDKDILFIHSKLEKKVQTILYKRGADTPPELSNLLQRPIYISPQDWLRSDTQYFYYQVLNPMNKLKTLLRILGEMDLHKTVIISKPGPSPAAIEKNLNAYGYPCIQAGGPSRNFTDAKADFCAASHRTNLDREIDSACNLLYYDIPEDGDFFVKSFSLLDENQENPNIVFVGTKEELELIEKFSEVNRMTIKTEENPTEKDALEGAIKKIITAIKEDSDPEELNYLKGLIRKHVPLTMRGYFAAYLLQKQSGAKRVPATDMQTLFVSIGKNRSIFPKDLAKFFAVSLNISQSDIGTIKILDNYSFIEVAAGHAQKAIDTLDGKEFKGRKITVNFARKKEDKQ